MESTKNILIKNKLLDLLPFLSKESFKDLDMFFNSGIHQKLPKDKIISVEGDSCSFFSFLLKGVIRVYKIGSSGREITLYRINQGGSCILTASCILSSKKFPAMAVTEEDTEVISFPADLFKDWVSRYSVWQQYVFNLVSERLSDVISVVEEIAFKKVDLRIVEKLIHFLSENINPIELTHQELASDIGTSREVVSRILKDFEEKKIISISRGQIKILDKEKLETYQKKI